MNSAYRIISGGQTGVDQAGLAAAREVGFSTGGLMPAGYRTENGKDFSLARKYGLKEDTSRDYQSRTVKNVIHSDVTLWWGTENSPGYHCTYNAALKYNKPFYVISTTSSDEVVKFILNKGYKTLNIAGHRESKYPGIYEKAFKGLLTVFGKLKAASSLDLPHTDVGDIWLKKGYKIITTNLGGVHGRGLAKQAKDKGLINHLHVDFDSRPVRSTQVITLAVKGKAPETAKYKGKAFSEQVINGNVDLLESEVDKLIAFARENPDQRFNLPYAGLGFGEGRPEEIMPILNRAADEPNIVLVSKDAATIKRYEESFKPGCRRDATTRVPDEDVEVIDWGINGWKTTITRMTTSAPLVQQGADEFKRSNWHHPILPENAVVCSADKSQVIFEVEEEGPNSGVCYYFANDPKLVEIDHITPGDSSRECIVITCDIIPLAAYKVVNDPSNENIEAFWADVFSEVPVLEKARSWEEKLYALNTWAMAKVNEVHQYVEYAYLNLSEEDFCEFYGRGLEVPMPYWMVLVFNLECVAYLTLQVEDDLNEIAPLATHAKDMGMDDATIGPFYYENVVGISSWGGFYYPRKQEDFGEPNPVTNKAVFEHYAGEMAEDNVDILWNVVKTQTR